MRPLKALLTNISFLIIAAVVVVIISIFFSVRFHDYNLFARFGAVVTQIGGLLATRRIIRHGLAQLLIGKDIIDFGHAIPTPEEIESLRQDRLDRVAAICSFFVIFGGTVIWAFGDLLLKWVLS
jgi:hypothetical protein